MAKKKKNKQKANQVNTTPVTAPAAVEEELNADAVLEEATLAASSDAPASTVQPEEIDTMVNEFRSPKTAGDTKVVEPPDAGTADALTSIPKASQSFEEPPHDDVAVFEDRKTEKKAAVPGFKKKKRIGIMRFFGAVVPRYGDSAFDVIRKVIMVVGIVVFIGAATYLVDDLVLIPYQNQVLAETLDSWYTPGVAAPLTKEEANYQFYPEGIDPAFKKLYYNNHDVRGWLSFHSTDNSATINVEYPILQSTDNDFYLYHDFNKTYNKNGALFFDCHNNFATPSSVNYNTIVYGHNMASGQMLAGLNKLLYGVNYARVAPTFKMDTLYGSAEYKIFAVMVINTESKDGNPFNYIRTDFRDVMDYADFLANIRARSLYDYRAVDVRPDDQIVMLSTCNTKSEVRFNNGRTVVVARKVRKDEAATTDVNQIVNNSDVIMPYGWYAAQKFEPHPVYVDPAYQVPPLDTLQSYLDGVTTPSDTTTTLGGSGITLPTMPTTSLPLGTTTTTTTTTTAPTQPVIKSLYIQYTPKVYRVGEGFAYNTTQIFAVYTDGSRTKVNARHCAIENFSTASPGSRFVTVHYGPVKTQFKITVISADAPTTPPVTETTTTTEVTTPTTEPSDDSTGTAAPATQVTVLHGGE